MNKKIVREAAKEVGKTIAKIKKTADLQLKAFELAAKIKGVPTITPAAKELKA